MMATSPWLILTRGASTEPGGRKQKSRGLLDSLLLMEKPTGGWPAYFMRSKFFLRICHGSRPALLPCKSVMIDCSLAFLVGRSVL